MARSFNGSTDKIVGASVTPINFDYNQPFSVAGWFWLTVNGLVYSSLVGHLDTAANFRGWELARQSTSKVIEFFLVNTYSTHVIQKATNAVVGTPTATWFHAAATYDGSNDAADGKTDVYLNAVANGGVTTFNNLGTNTTTNAIPPFIGQRNDGTIPLNGRASDVAVWNVKLTASEIGALYRGLRPFTVRSKALVSYWPLDGLQSPEPDLSGNVNNGTLTGTAFAAGPSVTKFTPWYPTRFDIPTGGPSIQLSNMAAHFIRKPTYIGY